GRDICLWYCPKVSKGFPKNFIEDRTMKQGDLDWRVSDTGIIALKWIDNKPVHFLSNFQSSQDVELVSRKQKGRSREQFNTIKLEMAANPGRCLLLKEFRLAVANGIIGADPETSERGRKSTEKLVNKFKIQVPLERRLDKLAHMPVHGTKIRCANCSTRDKPHRTR
ncbi:hypothetical protein ILUMI_08647, partial [Ignelater luminosus]